MEKKLKLEITVDSKNDQMLSVYIVEHDMYYGANIDQPISMLLRKANAMVHVKENYYKNNVLSK